MIDELLLTTKNDIPFPEAQLTLKQPTIKEIGMIGEESFFTGCQLLTVSKDKVQNKSAEEIDLSQITNFSIFTQIVHDKSPAAQKNRVCAQLVLLLLLPDYKVNFLPRSIVFVKPNQQEKDKMEVLQVDEKTFDKFQSIVKEMFCLDQLFSASGEYDPGNEAARKLAEKFRKYHEELAKRKNSEGQTYSIFSRYISILAVGQKKSMNTLSEYSVYQLLTQFQRYCKKEEYDMYIRAKMMGAKDLDEVDNWMGDLNHPDKE